MSVDDAVARQLPEEERLILRVPPEHVAARLAGVPRVGGEGDDRRRRAVADVHLAAVGVRAVDVELLHREAQLGVDDAAQELEAELVVRRLPERVGEQPEHLCRPPT